MDWPAVAQGLFACMALAISGWVAKSISELNISVKEMRDSMSTLNTSMAVIVARTDNHEDRLSRLEDNRD